MNIQLISSVEEQMTDILRTDLISGEYEAGYKMNETVLASNFGISRSIIRRVLLIIYKEGLLYKDGHGYYVIAPLKKKTEKVLLDLRLAIEEFAITHFKKTSTDHDINALEAILSRMNDHCKNDRHLEFIKADIEFHKYYVFFAGGEDLVNIWYPTVIKIHMSRGVSKSHNDDVEEHASILYAIKNNDTKDAIAAVWTNIKQ